MINLLPSEQKEELKQEKSLRLVLVLGTVVLAFLASLTLILFLIKISISADLEVQKIYFLQKEKELEKPEIQKFETKIKNYNSTFSRLEAYYKNQIELTSVLEKIFQTIPQEIYLNDFNFNPQKSEFSLTGFSPTREILLQFRENLEKKEDFKEISFPTAVWTFTDNIDFSVKFKI